MKRNLSIVTALMVLSFSVSVFAEDVRPGTIVHWANGELSYQWDIFYQKTLNCKGSGGYYCHVYKLYNARRFRSRTHGYEVYWIDQDDTVSSPSCYMWHMNNYWQKVYHDQSSSCRYVGWSFMHWRSDVRGLGGGRWGRVYSTDEPITRIQWIQRVRLAGVGYLNLIKGRELWLQ